MPIKTGADLTSRAVSHVRLVRANGATFLRIFFADTRYVSPPFPSGTDFIDVDECRVFNDQGFHLCLDDVADLVPRKRRSRS